LGGVAVGEPGPLAPAVAKPAGKKELLPVHPARLSFLCEMARLAEAGLAKFVIAKPSVVAVGDTLFPGCTPNLQVGSLKKEKDHD
jgi:hypothetical protein